MISQWPRSYAAKLDATPRLREDGLGGNDSRPMKLISCQLFATSGRRGEGRAVRVWAEVGSLGSGVCWRSGWFGVGRCIERWGLVEEPMGKGGGPKVCDSDVVVVAR